ncbi:BglG family transcription antiterminator [Clostridium oceanicum]|uniref:BglG family transcription antiterminator n=1 Tax=Clostridium oceanicum TaxID=1543 RepID=A0ABN1JLR0_9CLOT
MRELNILNDLIETNRYLSIEYFIDKYSVSKRTVQSDFSYLTNISLEKGFTLIKKRGKGYLIEVNDEKKLNDFIRYLKKLDDKPKINVENIVAYIALKNKYVTNSEMVKEFYSSKSLISKFKKDVDDYLKKYNFTAERKAHYGVRINQPLEKRKKLIVDLYLKNNEVVREYIDKKIDKDFKYIEESLIEEIKDKNLVINYFELNEILVWLKVIIYIKLEVRKILKEDIDSTIQLVIKEKYDVSFSKEDKRELDELIRLKTKNQEKNDDHLENLEEDICEFLENLDKNNNTSFNKDQQFKKLLTLHISSLISRLKFKVSYTNPIVDELSIKYASIFNMAISFGDMLHEKYGIKPNRDEIGFIATHFAVHMEKEFTNKLKRYNKIAIVCSSGGGSAYLTKLKISNLFNKSEIKTFSIVQIKELERYKPDIVFSTININLNLQVPLIYIKELLDDYDILKIKQLVSLDKIEPTFMSETQTYYIKRFFSPDYFTISNMKKDYIKCLKDMASKVEKDGIGGENYTQLVLKRESFSSTIYLNGVAIPHPIEMVGNKDLVFINILKTPIVYGDKKVNIIFMVSLQKENLELHKKITKDLFEIMNDKKMIQDILKVKSFKEFTTLISKNV